MAGKVIFIASITICTLFIIILACGGSTPPDSEFSKVTRHIATQFMGDLKAELTTALQDTAGVPGAVYVCAEKAPEISAYYSSFPGLSVRRASAKYRNPMNAPNEYETKALEVLASRTAAAGDEYFEWTEANGVKTFHYVKAIKITGPCLNCHGNTEKMSPEMVASLSDKYPEDLATGYKVGDLRGVFTVSVDWPDGKATVDSILASL